MNVCAHPKSICQDNVLFCGHITYFLIQIINIWIYVISRVSSYWPAIVGSSFVCDKNLDISCKLLDQSSILVMFIDTTDLDHFIPLSVALTLPGGQKVSKKQNLFSPTQWEFVYQGKLQQLHWLHRTSLTLVWVWLLWRNFVRTCFDIYYWTRHSDTCLSDLMHISPILISFSCT